MMPELMTFFIISILISIFDMRSMAKSGSKKEIIPYLVLMLISGATGFLYFTDPYRKSIVYFILNIFHIQG